MKSNKKIGIFTLHRALNYGAVWQCYALKQACESMGHVVSTIDYNPFGHYEAKWAIGRRPSTAYRYLMFLRRFNRFVDGRLNPTIHSESHEWMIQNPPRKDVYIVGSDTVWANTVVGDYLGSYLLDFAPAEVKRISYAASTGGNPLVVNNTQHAELHKFSAISIREKQSVADVQALVDVPVVDVCDPTLLLTKTDYEALEERPIWLPKHYVVYFDLAGDPFCAASTKEISKKLNIPILNLAGKYKSWARYNYLAPTPEQWLYIINHADYICTNSFHGVCFSIIYRKSFICCETQVGGRSKTNGRVQNLLEQTHLKNTYITHSSQLVENIMSVNKVVENEIFIEEYRQRSLLWLKNAIEQ